MRSVRKTQNHLLKKEEQKTKFFKGCWVWRRRRGTFTLSHCGAHDRETFNRYSPHLMNLLCNRLDSPADHCVLAPIR